MEFTLINLWVNCARLYASLNNQGGNKTSARVYDGEKHPITFPTAFTSKCIDVILTLGSESSKSGANVCYCGSITKTGFKIIADSSHESAYHDIYYLAIGI